MLLLLLLLLLLFRRRRGRGAGDGPREDAAGGRNDVPRPWGAKGLAPGAGEYPLVPYGASAGVAANRYGSPSESGWRLSAEDGCDEYRE